MTLAISNTTISQQLFQPNLKAPSVSLQTIKNAKGDINQIIMLLNENKEVCLELFRKAIKEKDSISQIELSQAYFGIKCKEEESKNFPSTQYEDLDAFCYCPRDFYFFTATYCEAMKSEYNYKLDNQIAENAFRDAASREYLPAFLELTCKIWENHTKSYGFAIQLRPFIGKGNKVIDYYFGRALKHGSNPGSKLFYEGLYWMHKSDGIPVQYPQKNESFDQFTHRYYRSSEGRMYSYYRHDDFIYANEGSAILAPSREKWEAFLKEKIETAEIAPKESYSFEYDEKKLLSLLKNNIGTVSCERFQASSTGQEMANDYDRKIPGFWIYSLSLYDGSKKIGTISVRKNTSTDNKYPFEIYKQIKNEKVQPIIDFLENIMVRTGSPSSADCWLNHLKDKQYFFPSC